MNIMEGVARTEGKCLMEAQGKIRTGLQQHDVNAILLEQAQCECKRGYSGTRPDVQLAFGRCAGKFATSEGAGTFSRRVTQCLDGDFGTLAAERAFSLGVDGVTMYFADPTYQPPHEQPRAVLSTNSATQQNMSIRRVLPLLLLCPLWVII
jgi:hypothetical protein